MIDAWNGAKDDEGIEPIVEFLAGCGDAKAIRALNNRLEGWPVSVRLEVLFALYEHGNMFELFPSANGDHRSSKGPLTARQKELKQAILELLVNSLQDTEVRTGIGGIGYGVNLDDPRICDMAGNFLNQLDPRQFPFKFESPLEQREQSRIAIINTFRREQGLAPLPVVEHQKIADVPEAKLAPLLARIEHGHAADAVKARNAIEELGPGALAGTLKRMRSLKPDSSKLAVFDELSRRLATTIVEIRYSDKSLKPDADIRQKLESLKGKPADATAMSDAVISIGRHLKKSAPGLCLTLSHPAGGAGATLQVDIYDKTRAAGIGISGWIAPHDSSPKDSPYAWRQEFNSRVDGKSVAVLWSVGEMNSKDLRRIFGPLESTPMNKSLEIQIQLIGIWR